ncbi:MAG: ABC transporter six-transmembrane domain-containing protein [Caulobacterales bacterium]|nr:ABC transporter six-transmembrane domain-containing protein [Caulobacterales bacterium]
MMLSDQKLSIGSLIGAFWRQVSVTWGLTFLETLMLAALPLLIGRAIDGLLTHDYAPFLCFTGTVGVLLLVATGRRVYDTRAYGAMRVELGAALAANAQGQPVSTVNARLDMSRELVDFLEEDAPLVLTAIVQLGVSLAILMSFDAVLAGSAGIATLAVLAVYGVFSARFFTLNAALNGQTEKQVATLEGGVTDAIRTHLSLLRRHEVRLSDTEALVYGLIFAVLVAMLSFNLWFAAAHSGASPGQIFSIVTYSYEFIESAVALPATLQSLTRMSEITQRINNAVKETP